MSRKRKIMAGVGVLVVVWVGASFIPKGHHHGSTSTDPFAGKSTAWLTGYDLAGTMAIDEDPNPADRCDQTMTAEAKSYRQYRQMFAGCMAEADGVKP